MFNDGCHRVSSGSFEWKLRHFTNIGACIGIIKDLPMEQISVSLDTVRYDLDGHGAFFEVKSTRFYARKSTDFMEEFRDKNQNNDVIVGMKIDLKSGSLYYSVDDSEYVKAPYTLDSDESYRLVVSFFRGPGAQVELL